MKSKNYYCYEFVRGFMPIYPVYAILFAMKGLDVAQISLLFIIWTIPEIVLEIPSGIVADRWSRKNLLVMASILQAMCLICWLLSDGFCLFAVGFVCWGLSTTLSSGAKEALLYDSLKCSKQEERFAKVYGRGQFFGQLSEGTACVLGGILAEQFGMTLPLIISMVAEGVTFAITLSFRCLINDESFRDVDVRCIGCSICMEGFDDRVVVAIHPNNYNHIRVLLVLP